MQLSPEDYGDADIVAAIGLVEALYAPEKASTVLAAVEAAGFSRVDFFARNPDLKNHFKTALRATLHFLSMVKTERRDCCMMLRLDGVRQIWNLKTHDRDLIKALLACLADSSVSMGHFPDYDAFVAALQIARNMVPYGAQPYVLFGDSHSRMYRRSGLGPQKWLLPIHVCCTAGSALGLHNRESRTRYGETLQKFIAYLEEATGVFPIPLFFQFGQVDTEFLYPFRRVRSGAVAFSEDAYQDFCKTTVAAYVDYISRVVPPRYLDLAHVIGIFPPALDDTILREGYTNPHITEVENITDNTSLIRGLRALQWPTKAERTRHHAFFNQQLQIAATQAGFRFVSDFESLLSGGEVLNEDFIPFYKGRDHHLDFKPAEALFEASLWRWIGRCDS